MSRSGVSQNPSDGWYMVCDFCWERSEVRPKQYDFPLIEFAAKGWLIGEVSDACNVCVALGRRPRNVWTQNRLERDYIATRDHCLKYYGRDLLSPYKPEQ